MCAEYNRYLQLYDDHAGLPGYHHAWRVRMARELLNVHRARCPLCREDGVRTNYNLRPPRRITYRMTRGTE